MKKEENSHEKGDKFVQAGKGKPIGLFAELIEFIKETRKFWMIPLLVVLFILGALIWAGGTQLAPFIYTLF
tara:strand:- start:4705 stop:4917 length:213 start_codon:yes stop_codon:yes gene_type:complete